MKKLSIIAITATLFVGVVSCSKVKRNPGRVYMPDMAYSRAYETYSQTHFSDTSGVHFNALPVKGTIARGDILDIYTLPNDSIGYAQSGSVTNPFSYDSIDKKESERLYLVNCGICHGTKLDGNGPLYNDGNGPFPNKPANLATDPKYQAMAAGTMFHVVTYGKNSMGSYASQLSAKQRWMVIAYVKHKQGGDTLSASTPASTMVTTDTAAKMPK